jgi:hypothetical protein
VSANRNAVNADIAVNAGTAAGPIPRLRTDGLNGIPLVLFIVLVLVLELVLDWAALGAASTRCKQKAAKITNG